MREEVAPIVPLPPQSIESEQTLLGGLLIDNAAWDRIQDVVCEQDFYTADHREIFRHIQTLIELNRPADAYTMPESLKSASSGVASSYIRTLALNCPSSANIRHYAEIIRDRAHKRAVIAVAMELGEQAYQPGTQATDLVADAVARLYGLQQRQARRGARGIGAVLSAVVEKIDALYSRENKHAVVGLATGFADLDRITAGLQAGDLVIVAGRPSMGKTALAMNVVEHVAIRLTLPCLVFSLEMSDEQLVQRMIGSVGHMDQHALKTGSFPESDWSKLTQTVGVLNEAPIIIEETAGLTVSDVRAIAHRVNREKGLGLIVIDYLQLMQTRGENRNNELGEITRALKALAKELKVPVIALSQLNRDVEKRGNKRPQMADLRDSGSIEQDADLILMLYRDEVYDEDSERKGIAEVIIGKHRNGPTGTVHLTFLGKYARFENFAGELAPRRLRTRQVSNFHDYKTRAAGDD